MKVILNNVRLSFPKLWTPEAFEEGNTPRYGCNVLVEPGSDNDKAIRGAIAAVAEEKHGAKAKAFLDGVHGHSGKFCYQDGNGKADKYEGYAGMWSLAANRNADQGAPKVVDLDKTPLGEGSGKPYAGCYVNVSVDIWCQTGKYAGIRCTLVAVQFVKDGDAFAGAPASADDFDDLSGGADALSDFI